MSAAVNPSAATGVVTGVFSRAVRNAQRTAEPRALIYAVFSKILTSPFDVDDERAALVFNDETTRVLDDIEPKLPFAIDFSALGRRLGELAGGDRSELRREYSALFEVGDDGPPAPLRAELVRVKESKMKEEIVRFYDYFSYDLAADFAWAPDHLAVMLEFMQVLCLKEAAATDDDARKSLARAQLDFLDRHLVSWLPISISRLVEQRRDGFYTHVMTKLWEFLEQDRIWNGDTVTPAATEA